MSLTKKQREAALLLSIGASNCGMTLVEADNHVAVEYESLTLALDARRRAANEMLDHYGFARYYETCAEAECLIREGWEP